MEQNCGSKWQRRPCASRLLGLALRRHSWEGKRNTWQRGRFLVENDARMMSTLC